MKQITIVKILVLLSFSLSAQDKQSAARGSGEPIHHPKHLDIFLMIGQSNMSGIAKILPLDTLVLKNVYLFNDNEQWEQGRNLPGDGMNRYSSVGTKKQRLGPQYSFSRKVAAYTGREIGIVSNSLGGTSIAQWQKGFSGEKDYNLYEEAVKRAKAALTATPGSRIKAIIWHQGESDQATARSEVYLEKLKTLVDDLRTDLGDQDIFVIAGEIGKWKGRGRLLNPKIREIKSTVSKSDWISSDGLTSLNLEKNDPHFDTFSQRVLGSRFADKVLEAVFKISPGSVTLFTEKGYEGRSATLRNGEYTAADLESMGIKPQEITSIKIDPKTEVLLYSEEQGTKPNRISKSNPGLKAANLSLIKISSKK